MDAKSKSRPRVDLVTWRPRVEHDDITFFYADPKLWHSSPVTLVRAATSHTLVLLEKIEAFCAPDVLALNKTTIKNAASYLDSLAELQSARGILVPFAVVQNSQLILDEYAETLQKITKNTRMVKYADKIESLRMKFMISVNLCLNSGYFVKDVKTATGEATPFTPREYTVLPADADTFEDKPNRFDDFSCDDRSSRSASIAPRVPPVVRDTTEGIEGMLLNVLEDLGCAHDTTLTTIESFDDVCNKYLHDQDRINPLLSIFTKLRQLDEDMKEVAKEVSKLCGQDVAEDEFEDDENPITWWGRGGQYDDGAAS